MGRRKAPRAKASSGGGGGGGGEQRRPARAAAQPPHNFLPEAGAGCHIAHLDAPWIVGLDTFDPDDFEPGAALPDLGMDPDDGLLTAVNTSDAARTFYISTRHGARGAGGRPLQRGWSRDDAGVVTPCTTFVLVVAPRTLMAVAHLEVPAGEALDLDSDVQDFVRHPSPEAFDARHVYGFPLGGRGPFLCTQGFSGGFTHFFAGTHHAIDFRCAVGTPILSVAAGVVSEVREAHRCGGVHVRNLFRWNSVTVAHADGTHAEYVHTAAGSARVAVGNAVAEGQHIADSGDVGFCPEPHLHMQLHASGATDAPTLRFALRCDAGGGASGASGASFFEPQAGLFYGAGGEAPRPAEEEED